MRAPNPPALPLHNPQRVHFSSSWSEKKVLERKERCSVEGIESRGPGAPTLPPASNRAASIPRNGLVAEPGLVGVAPGSGVSRTPPLRDTKHRRNKTKACTHDFLSCWEERTAGGHACTHLYPPLCLPECVHDGTAPFAHDVMEPPPCFRVDGLTHHTCHDSQIICKTTQTTWRILQSKTLSVVRMKRPLPRILRDDRSCLRTGSSPKRIRARMAVGAVYS
jgi:hypothetical protein